MTTTTTTTTTTTYTMAPAPGALPVLGHALRMLRDPLGFLGSLHTHADLVQLRLGTVRTLVVCHPRLLHQVMVDDRIFDKGGPLCEVGRDLLGNGLATCPHAEHRGQRRLAQPAFHHTRLPGYARVMTDHITDLTHSWSDGQRLDVRAEMTALIAAVLAATLFATGHTPEQAEQIRRDLTTVEDGVLRRAVLPRALMALPMPGHRRYTQAKTRLRDAISRIIADYRRGGVDHGDLMSLYLFARDGTVQGLSETEIHTQVLIVFLAGFTTTAAALAWTFHLLGQHPDIQHRLHTEAHTVLAGRTASWEDLPQLELTSRVITEALRLYPPSWITTRATTTDTDLGGHRLPAGTNILFSPCLVHYRPDVYPDAHRFDPDRWLDHDTTSLTRDCYIPFGGGARKCIGDTFGLTVATLALASIAARWRLHPVLGTRVRRELGIAVAPRELPMRAERYVTP